MSGEQLELLEELAGTAPQTYLQKQPSGQSTLRELYALAAQANLVPPSAQDDIARLHSLWDVALDHGLGGLVRDYVSEVCADRLLTSSDPVEAFLLDGECVRRWVQKLLAVSRGRLASWLGRGLASVGAAGVLPKELGRLQMLQLVAEALQPRAEGGAATSVAGESAELAEARRLVQCARVLGWLGGQQLAFDRSTGRYFSEQEWRSVAAKRRDGAAAAAGGAGLFLMDLAAELAAAGVDAVAYPPPSADRLLSVLFLGSGGGAGGGGKAGSGGSGERGLHAKLALLTYYLADGSFMQPAAIVQGLRTHFHVPPSTAHAWLLQQLLDDAHTADPSGAAALQRAAELAPAVDGAALPLKALQVFAVRGRLEVALALLRQRPETTTSLEEASVALAVRLRNGLLGEGFLGLRRHLAAAAAAAPSPAAAAEVQRRHAALLVGQLLQFAAVMRPSAVHAVMRMPFGAAEEEAVVGWLEAQAGAGTLEAALMLPLYFLLRGRTPEALQAYVRHCPPTPTTQEQQELSMLLTEAACMLPAPQRDLVLAGGSGGEGGMDVAGGGAAAPGPAVAVGATPAQSPLVGSIPVLLEQQRLAAAAAEPAAGGEQAAAAGGAAQQQRPQQPHQPLLFGQPAGGGAGTGSRAAAAAMSTGGGGGGFGSGLAANEAMLPVGGGSATGGHEFDRVLGVGATLAGSARGGKGKRRFGGSAYR